MSGYNVSSFSLLFDFFSSFFFPLCFPINFFSILFSLIIHLSSYFLLFLVFFSFIVLFVVFFIFLCIEVSMQSLYFGSIKSLVLLFIGCKYVVFFLFTFFFLLSCFWFLLSFLIFKFECNLCEKGKGKKIRRSEESKGWREKKRWKKKGKINKIEK